MSRNGQRHPRRPRIELSGGSASASPQEAAAITAAVEQFMRDTAPPPEVRDQLVRSWLRTALLEGTRHGAAGPSAWGDPVRWG